MLRKFPRLSLAAIGALFGLGFGLTYWFAWGCRKCAKDGSPSAILVFCTAVGAGMALLWGKDHLPRSSAGQDAAASSTSGSGSPES